MASSLLRRLIAVSITSSLWLGGCAAGNGSGPPSNSVPASNTPAEEPVIPYRAALVASLGLSTADTEYPRPLGAFDRTLAFCDGEKPLPVTPARAWSATSEAGVVDEDGNGSREDVKTIGATFSGLAWLTGDVGAVDRRIKTWSSCRNSKQTRTPMRIDVPGSHRLAAWTWSDASQHRAFRNGAFVAARVRNLLLVCEARGVTLKDVEVRATRCATDMAAGISLVARPGSDPISVRLRLAALNDSRHAAVPAATYPDGCLSRKLLFEQNTPEVSYYAKSDDGDLDLYPSDTVRVDGRASIEEAKARMIDMRKVMETCKDGRVTSEVGPGILSTSKVVSTDFGDGGFSWTTNAKWAKSESSGHTTIFRSGPYLIQVSYTDTNDRSELASRIVAALER